MDIGRYKTEWISLKRLNKKLLSFLLRKMTILALTIRVLTDLLAKKKDNMPPKLKTNKQYFSKYVAIVPALVLKGIDTVKVSILIMD